MRPMLAGSLEVYERVDGQLRLRKNSGRVADLPFPVWCTPKLDGIRCLTRAGVNGDEAVSRKLLPIPNDFIRTRVARLGPGLDGELILRGAKQFGETSSAVMTRAGEPAVDFHVFDVWGSEGGYLDRIAPLAEFVRRARLPWLKLLRPDCARNEAEVRELEARYVAQGFEGLMCRTADGPYKFGRSTVREAYLLKLKQFEDFEAEVIGFEELEHNENVQARDNLGRAKRSTHKAGKVAGGTLGAFVCRRLADDVEFTCGSGISRALAAEVWADRPAWLGATITVASQPHGAKEAPRSPVFRGRRFAADL